MNYVSDDFSTKYLVVSTIFKFLAPPTYEEAMSIASNTSADADLSNNDQEPSSPAMSKPFMPRYPVYNFDDPTNPR